MSDDVEFGAGWVVGLLVAFAVPPVALLVGGVTGGVDPGLSLASILVPLLALAVVLARLAYHVGSSADDPELVEEAVGNATGTSGDEYEDPLD